MNVIIIHGAYGSPEENWIPWLKRELEKSGSKVFAPKFPTPKNQTLQNWLKVFEKYEKYLNKDTILIGHSLGPAFILRILERLNKPVKASFFIAGFISKLNNPDFDEINKTFLQKKFNWRKIRQNCRNFYILYSDNDPYVPQGEAKKLALNLNVEPILIKNAGHFNKKAGYYNFPLLLKTIKMN